MGLDGRRLVRLARGAIEAGLSGKPPPETRKSASLGAFVTLHSLPGRRLRGCVGFPYPVLPLEEAVVQSALSAAFSDNRFPPVSQAELKSIVIEVSVLSEPQELKCRPEDIPGKIVIGRDGLVVERHGRRGLLLPVVAAEEKLGAEEFLSHCCLKAGLPEESWRRGAKVSVFRAEVFSENQL
ncbi:MAG: AmmeMemoRadiSam system protein A [Candidatus Micrarchaeota archaeon]